MTTTSDVAAAERIADAVLYEGYLLYPYRASALKNRLRWQFGVIAPKPPSDSFSEPWFSQTECLIEEAMGARLSVRIRFLTLYVRENPAGTPESPAWLDGTPQAIDVDD